MQAPNMRLAPTACRGMGLLLLVVLCCTHATAVDTDGPNCSDQRYVMWLFLHC